MRESSYRRSLRSSSSVLISPVVELLTALTSLTSAAVWGASDFAGGLAGRRAAAIRVILAAQLIGAVLLIAFVALRREPLPPRTDLVTGAIAGVGGALGLFLLYYSLAAGKMGVAAPLTAVSSVGVPLVVGMLTEGAPGTVTLLGFALALAAIWIISHPDGGHPLRPRDIALPLLAGVGFGVYLTLLGRIDDDTTIVWPLLAARATGIAALVIVLIVGRGHAPSSAKFPWLLVILAGVGDIVGSALYTFAAQIGRLDVAAVLSSLYPATTVLLARVVLGERLTRRQNLGVIAALAAVVLITI